MLPSINTPLECCDSFFTKHMFFVLYFRTFHPSFSIFVSEGGPYPAVLDLFGGIGGTVEHRSALLASRGFASLALEYLDIKKFAFKNDLSYFEVSKLIRYMKWSFENILCNVENCWVNSSGTNI